MEHFRDVVQSRVCRKCIDANSRGECRLPPYEVCPLAAFFPVVVDTILAVSGTKYSAYVKALRTNICAHCDEQSPDGECKRRNTAECPLDLYYPTVIQAVEELDVPWQPGSYRMRPF